MTLAPSLLPPAPPLPPPSPTERQGAGAAPALNVRAGKLSSALAALLVVAVGLAFADAAVVVLALPDIYGQFHTSMVGVSWVLTTYAVVVAVAALGVALVARRVRPAVLTGIGLGLFAGASLAAGLSSSYGLLLGARCVQGVGAALLLGGSIAVLGALRGADARGRVWWAWAATIGTALGPALGGVLTELFDWRAIFLVQAPLAALALVALLAASSGPRPAPLRRRDHHATGSAPEASPLLANLGFILLFAGARRRARSCPCS